MSSLVYPGIETDISAACSAKGSRLLNREETTKIVSAAGQRNLRLHTVESVEIRSDAEILRLDLSMFGYSDASNTGSWAERVQRSKEEIERMLQDASTEGVEIRFRIWLGSETS